ncbi:MAG: hypothetical protein ACLSAF_06520 [Intestinimonas sp.]
MFYRIPTRERDTRTTLAEKNRYQPWSGSPMAGRCSSPGGTGPDPAPVRQRGLSLRRLSGGIRRHG